MAVHDLWQSRMMRHLLTALEEGKDIGHYGRLTFAIIGQYFLDRDELVQLLAKHGNAAEARELAEQVAAHQYNPPSRQQILEWQAQQVFPICPTPEDPDSCNIYRDLTFPNEVYDNISAHRRQSDGIEPSTAPRSRPVGSNTERNLAHAIAGEAEARLKYTAFAMQAMQEHRPEIAQLFLEAAGAETIHGISHLRVAGGVGTTAVNLDAAANGEDDEIEVMYPRFIREAEADGRADAVASFRLALERERHHRTMFKKALAVFANGAARI